MVRPLRLLFTRLTRQLLFPLPRRSCGGRNLCSQGFRFLPAQERRGKGAALWLLLALAVLVGTACFTPTARPGSTLPTPPTLPPVVVAATPTPAPTRHAGSDSHANAYPGAHGHAGSYSHANAYPGAHGHAGS